MIVFIFQYLLPIFIHFLLWFICPFIFVLVHYAGKTYNSAIIMAVNGLNLEIYFRKANLLKKRIIQRIGIHNTHSYTDLI